MNFINDMKHKFLNDYDLIRNSLKTIKSSFLLNFDEIQFKLRNNININKDSKNYKKLQEPILKISKIINTLTKNNTEKIFKNKKLKIINTEIIDNNIDKSLKINKLKDLLSKRKKTNYKNNSKFNNINLDIKKKLFKSIFKKDFINKEEIKIKLEKIRLLKSN